MNNRRGIYETYKLMSVPHFPLLDKNITATFRFYEELNDFLPKHRRKVDFETKFEGKRSVKEMVDALGVPPSEIDLILANGRSVGFDYILKAGDRFSVYPVFESLNIKHVTRLRDVPLRKTRFIAHKNTNDIVKRMRLLGYDIYCDPALSDREMIDISNREKRIILTKSKTLLESKQVSRGLLIRPGTTSRQVKKIIEYLDINDAAKLSSGVPGLQPRKFNK